MSNRVLVAKMQILPISSIDRDHWRAIRIEVFENRSYIDLNLQHGERNHRFSHRLLSVKVRSPPVTQEDAGSFPDTPM